MVIPILTFACEMWVLNDEDVGLLNDFQVYAGRRVQRLHPKSPRESSYIGLGWISIEIYIYIYICEEAFIYKDSIDIETGFYL